MRKNNINTYQVNKPGLFSFLDKPSDKSLPETVINSPEVSPIRFLEKRSSINLFRNLKSNLKTFLYKNFLISILLA
jgi:hypothetical protein